MALSRQFAQAYVWEACSTTITFAGTSATADQQSLLSVSVVFRFNDLQMLANLIADIKKM